MVTGEYQQVIDFDRDRVERAWHALIEARPADLGAVRPYILDSWRRCLEMGMDPYTTRAPNIGRGEPLAARLRDNASLVEATRHTWHLLSETLQASESIFILTDRYGVEVESYGKPDLVRAAQREGVGAGYDWSERAAGTNAIATTLALNHPTIVRSAEHFCTAAKRWDCAAAPIRDLNDSTLLGVLDVTSVGDLSDSHTLALAVTAAHQIEHTLHSQELARSVQLLNWYRNASSDWRARAALLLDRKGRVITATDTLRALCGSLPSSVPLVDGRPRMPEDEVLRIHECVAYASPAKGGAKDGPESVPAWEGGVLVLERKKDAGKREQRAAPVQLDDQVLAPMFEQIAAASPGLLDAARRADRMAHAAAPILLTGETGTGKELFARAMHASSNAASGPFVAVNCGTLTKELAASELLGYEAGAFTGASSKGRRGKFEEADGGILFLDEIGDLPVDIQVQLLRVLQDKVVVRVGGNRERHVDVQVIAATNRDLEQEANEGRFRLDLYYRLKVLSLKLPPLRDRKEDISLLVDAFLREMQGLYGLGSKTVSDDLMHLMMNYPWPGNVRELRGFVESMYILSRRPVLTAADLPEDFAGKPLGGPRHSTPPAHSATLDQIECDAIVNELERTGGNLTEAAKHLGISRSTLYRKLDHYDIDYK
jgi:sigma-54 dependent transcriptional regulator, acetoin dehydrogenase operon transcriptional activator AcoR